MRLRRRRLSQSVLARFGFTFIRGLAGRIGRTTLRMGTAAPVRVVEGRHMAEQAGRLAFGRQQHMCFIFVYRYDYFLS